MFNFYATQFLLEVDVNQPIAGFADKLAYGGKMLLVGMGIVFAVLVSLCIVLLLFNAISSRLLSGDKTVSAPKKAAPVAVVAPQPAPSASNEQEEIIAVIAAAIAAASAENPSAKFRVVSFKRK